MYRAPDGMLPSFLATQRNKDSGGSSKKRAALTPSGGGGAGKEVQVSAKRKKKQDSKDGDSYCWLCHKDGVVEKCEACPRVYHSRCLGQDKLQGETWVCPECEKIVLSENVDTRSKAMKMLTVDQLCNLLKFAVARMKLHGDEAFSKPVSLESCPNYLDRIAVPMDLTSLEKNIKKKMYGCTESFLADSKWILHNCIIFNGYQHRLTSNAKQIVKTCRHEMNEIEACPDCYLNAYTKKENWFCEPCREPHLLIWSKLKGFPFWPAKVMQIVNGNIDVRFFGAHDRAWIPVNQCYLLSKDIPTPMKNKKKGSFEQSMEELELHIGKLQERFGKFHYAPNRITVDPDNLQKQVSVLLPQIDQRRKSLSQGSQAASKEARLLGTSRSSNSTNYVGGTENSAERLVRQSVIKHSVLRRDPNAAESTSTSARVVLSRSRSLDSSKNNAGSSSEHVPSKPVLKSRIESRKTLELTIERLKESATEKSDEDERDGSDDGADGDNENPQDSNTSEQNVSGRRNLSSELSGTDAGIVDNICAEQTLGTPRSSGKELCEVTSTTPNPAIELTVDVTDCDNSLSSTSQQGSSSSLTPPKKSSVFVQKLDRMIESCKAKLGIEEVGEVAPSEESSEDDVADKADKRAEGCKTAERPSLANQGSGSSNTENDSGRHQGSVNNEENRSVHKSHKTGIGRPGSPGNNSNQQATAQPAQGETSSKKLTKDSSGRGVAKDNSDSDSLSNSNIATSNRHKRKLTANSNDSAKDSCSSDESESKSTETNAKFDANMGSVPRESFDLDMECSDDDEGGLVIDLDKDTNESPVSTPATVALTPRAPTLKVRIKDGVHWTEKNKVKVKSKSTHRESSASATKNGSPSKKSTSAAASADHHSAGPKSPDNAKSSACSQITPKPMPALQPRPLPPTLAAGSSPAPSSPGPGCDMTKYSRKMMDFMCGTVEEMFKDMAKSGNLEAAVKTLQLEMEKMAWRHQQELAEIKHNTDLVLLEMRASMESEKQRAITEVRRQCDIEKQKATDETKKKQWCANCGKEAILYCCWNTSYCDYPCQQTHWPQHMSTCAQSQNPNETENVSASSTTVVAPTTTTTISTLTTKPSTQTQRTVTIHHGTSNTPISPLAPSKREESQTAWQKKSRDDLVGIFKRQQEEREREKQRLHIQMPQQQPTVSQASPISTQYGGPLQYIPSNAVQVIPQTSSLANSSALQVQYVANLPSQGSHISPGSNNMQQFTTVAGSAFPLQQGLSPQQQAGHRLLQQHQQQQQRPLQVSNSMYPIIIQPGPPLGLNQSNSSPSNTRPAYPRGPYIPGKPYHIS